MTPSSSASPRKRNAMIELEYDFTIDEKAQLILIADRARKLGKAELAAITIFKVFLGASTDNRKEADDVVAMIKTHFHKPPQ